MSLKKFLLIVSFTGLFIGLFPWVLAYKGEIAGVPVSLRALGDLTGVACAALGASLFFSKRLQEIARQLFSELEALNPPTQIKIILAATAVYAFGVISHKLRAQYMVGTHAFDLGFFSNICWNTVNGSWFYSSILERNFMAVHVNWILWPLACVYKLYSGAEVLLVAQALIIAAAVPPLWRATQKITGSFSAGLISAVLYMCTPYIAHAVSNDFHPDVWLVPCIFMSLLAWINGKRAQLLVFALLALLAKEDVSVVLCGFGIFLMLHKNWRWTGAVLFISSLAAFFFHTKYFTPKFIEEGQTSILYSRYGLLGSNFAQMASNLFLKPSVYVQAFFYEPSKFWRFACYFFPVAGLTLLSPLFLIPPIISVLPHILSQASTQLQLADIYSLPSQPFIFIGAAFGAKKLLERIGTGNATKLTATLFIVAGIGVFNSPRYFRSDMTARVNAFHEMKRLVPRDVSVAAQQNILPHFDTRRYIQLFPVQTSMPTLQTKVTENPDYIICDRIGNALPWNGQDLAQAIALLEKNAVYEKIFERENFMLFKRITR